MNAHVIAEALRTALDIQEPEHIKELIEEVRSAESFQDAGILTQDAGFVLRLKNGMEFQVTLVQSR